jgi:hypothetical protein
MTYCESIDYCKDSYFRTIEQNGLKYFPWIGCNFFLKDERILIVGESVYNWGKNEAERKIADDMLSKYTFARFVAFNHGLKSKDTEHKFARNLEKAILGRPVKNKDERIDFWQSISFHEFVQRPMNNRKERPSKDDYKKAALILIELINELKITKCIFSGTDWNKFSNIAENIKDKKSQYFPSKINGSRPKIIHINNEFNSRIYFIRHPSSFFSWKDWHKFIN